VARGRTPVSLTRASTAKKVRENPATATTTKPRPPGRPSALTHDVAWRLIGLIVAGRTITDAAAEVGVSPRSVRRWRRRA
jgi:hypothetical protein